MHKHHSLDIEEILNRFRDLNPSWLANLEDLNDAAASPSPEEREQLLKGALLFAHSTHRKWVEIGRRKIDWEGSHVDNQEWKAQINRFFHLRNLARCYLETGNDAFVEVIRDQILDWIDFSPPENYQPHPRDNRLNLAIRLQQWMSVLPFIANSPCWQPGDIDRIIASVQAQFNFLKDSLTIVHNWRIAQADSLFLTGYCYPGIEGAAEWLDRAVEVINEGVWRQFEKDGSHREHNPHYHGWMNSVFYFYWKLSERHPELGLKIPTELVGRMFSYHLATHGLEGAEGALHDSHAVSDDGIAQHHKRQVTALPPEALMREFCELSGTDPDSLRPPVAFFPDAGQAFIRSTEASPRHFLSFDATRWGGSHCHLSRNQLEFYLGDRRILRDPGILTYEATDPLMAYGKSTRAHNTANWNGWNQSFSDPVDTRVCHGDGRVVVDSEYVGGYWPGAYHWRFADGMGCGMWGFHHRTLLYVEGRFAVVMDALYREEHTPVPEGQPHHFVECNWNVDANHVEVEADALRAFTTHEKGDNLLIQGVALEQAPEWLHFHGSSDPLRGWMPRPGEVSASHLISARLGCADTSYAKFVTLLVPFEGKEAPKPQVTYSKPDPNFFEAIEVVWPDQSRDTIEWSYRLDYPLGPRPFGTTDAPLVHLHREPGAKHQSGFAAWGSRIEDCPAHLRFNHR